MRGVPAMEVMPDPVHLLREADPQFEIQSTGQKCPGCKAGCKVRTRWEKNSRCCVLELLRNRGIGYLVATVEGAHCRWLNHAWRTGKMSDTLRCSTVYRFRLELVGRQDLKLGTGIGGDRGGAHLESAA